ncbi:hypothetical protein B9G55_07535 [Saccharibacillus sp. O16]|nr:hypothetical protein B9G55_07535 [Saccharibacillus sp. O16]
MNSLPRNVLTIASCIQNARLEGWHGSIPNTEANAPLLQDIPLTRSLASHLIFKKKSRSV